MTVPSDPEDTPEARGEEPGIVLRLGEILPRVPPDLLMPGPHDTTLEVRFTIEELAEKIAHGRVTVPLERLTPAFPNVFREKHTAPGETDVQLPLQRLLDQVGLVAKKAVASAAVPSDQVALARAEAGRIIEANASRPVPAFATAPSVHAVRIAKAIFTARQVFGLFPKPGEFQSKAPKTEPVVDKSVKEAEKETPPAPADSTPVPPSEPTPTAPLEPTLASAGSISLRALPIFRLMSPSVSKSLPADENARLTLPLSAIEPQLAAGHVEVPIEDFVKALPETLRGAIQSTPGTHVWIPLDEIFQNLPATHPFYMPPLDLSTPEPAASEKEPEVAIPAEPIPVPEPAPPEAAAPAPFADPSASQDVPNHQEPTAVSETALPPIPSSPEVVATPESSNLVATQAAPPVIENTPTPEAAAAAPEVVPPAEVTPPPVEKKEPEPVAISEPAAPPESAPETEPAPEAIPAPRAPWVRGFQVPPPRVFATASEAPPVPLEPPAPTPAPAEILPAPAPTPEAKRTADFLAAQTGILAAAAFVQGAVFASADFPSNPDLVALCDFMGAFIERAEESGRQLGWSRILTISCEQFYLTAVVRNRHFIVALHHDRTLPPMTYDALVLAADDLSKSLDPAS
jgi:Meckel syndrome type 1 protein